MNKTYNKLKDSFLLSNASHNVSDDEVKKIILNECNLHREDPGNWSKSDFWKYRDQAAIML